MDHIDGRRTFFGHPGGTRVTVWPDRRSSQVCELWNGGLSRVICLHQSHCMSQPTKLSCLWTMKRSFSSVTFYRVFYQRLIKTFVKKHFVRLKIRFDKLIFTGLFVCHAFSSDSLCDPTSDVLMSVNCEIVMISRGMYLHQSHCVSQSAKFLGLQTMNYCLSCVMIQ